MKTRKQCEKIIEVVRESLTPDNRTFEEAETDTKKQKEMKTAETKCPKCNSTHIMWWTNHDEYLCHDCKYEWEGDFYDGCKTAKEIELTERESKYKELYEAMKELSKNVFMQCQLCPSKTHTEEFKLKEFKLREDKLRQEITELEKELGLNI